MSDPIADFLIRIKNGYLAGKKEISLPWSKINEALAKILVAEKYLEEVKMQKSKIKIMKIILKYEGKTPAISGIKRVSKPGLRVYRSSALIPQVRWGFGITVVSTPKGLMTDVEAKKKKLGGEIICQVW